MATDPFVDFKPSQRLAQAVLNAVEQYANGDLSRVPVGLAIVIRIALGRYTDLVGPRIAWVVTKGFLACAERDFHQRAN